ncbi:isochorismatase family protein [Patescibacteria group bacterium]|nr:isochorismatase family protein [Patescibacteria group bacterium]
MIEENLTAREVYERAKANPPKPRYGLGHRVALVNIDPQRAYTDVETFPKSAYETDPKQLNYTNLLAKACRAINAPVIWTYVAYEESGEDCGVWGTRSDTVDSLQNIKVDSDRSEFDPRLIIEPSDIIMRKRMASSFHETNLASLLVFHKVDTVIITGGSTSGCVRASAVDALSYGYIPVVPEECVADKHESPHFASLYDLLAKYADVMPVAELLEQLNARANKGDA